MTFLKYRGTLEEYTRREGSDGIFNYNTKKNSFSIDGLPSLALLRRDAPKYVEPNAQDGFIFGNVVVKPWNTNAIQEARKMHSSSKGTIQIRIIDLWIIGSLIFVSGIVTGYFVLFHLPWHINLLMFCYTHYSSSGSYMNILVSWQLDEQ